MRQRSLLLSTLIGLMPLALVACGEQQSADPRTDAPLVRGVRVAPASEAARAFTGVVAARVQSDLGFRVAGKVLERRVDTGQLVRRGQLLLRLDPADLQLAAHAQREAVVAARARAQQTREDEARYRALRGTGAVSAAAYDQYRAAADTAQAQLGAAEAQARLAGNATGYAELLADADGIVMATLAEPGQVVSAGQNVVRLAHAGPREAVVQLPETLRPALGSAAQATLFGQGKHVTARLRQLSDVADPLTRTFEARYVLDGELAAAPLGSTVTLQITREPAAQDSLQVPITALYDAGKGPGVWVIEGEPARVSWRAVAIQQLDEEHARISGPLSQGEQVVALGAHLLHEGQPVRLAAQDDGAAVAGVRP